MNSILTDCIKLSWYKTKNIITINCSKNLRLGDLRKLRSEEKPIKRLN